MFHSKIFAAFLLLTAGASLSVAAHALRAQQPASQAPATPAVHRIPYSPFRDIYVDVSCHLLPDPSHQAPRARKSRLRRDPMICHLESVLTSEHTEETIVGNELRRSNVRVTEQTYVLQNVTTDPAIFVVEEPVPAGWHVDSDPQPTETNGLTAVFRVHAQPGEIVHLHVGLRHTKPLPTKLIKASPLPAAGSTVN